MVMVVVSLEKYGKVKKKYTPFLQCYSEDCVGTMTTVYLGYGVRSVVTESYQSIQVQH